MRVEVIDRTEDFIVIETSADGLPAKRTSVCIDAIVDGLTTLDEQMELARQDGEKRLARLRVLNALLVD